MVYEGSTVSFWLILGLGLLLEIVTVALAAVVGLRNGFQLRGYVNRQTGQPVAPTWRWWLLLQWLPGLVMVWFAAHFAAGLPVLAAAVMITVVALVWRKVSRRQRPFRDISDASLAPAAHALSSTMEARSPATPVVVPSVIGPPVVEQAMWSAPVERDTVVDFSRGDGLR